MIPDGRAGIDIPFVIFCTDGKSYRESIVWISVKWQIHAEDEIIPFSTCAHKQKHTGSSFSAHFHGFYVHQDKCTPCMLIGLSAGCDLWCMASLRALISQMAFELANLSCDHLEITGNQYCSDGALILANNGINENEIRAAMNGGRWI